MAGKPAEPAPPGRSPSSAAAASEPRAHPSERIGPLDVERLRKDDGRALILYTLQRPPEPAPAPAGRDPDGDARGGGERA